MRTPVIGCGLYHLNLQCPECGVVVEIPVVLDTRLTMDSAGAKLAGKLNGKPIDHVCNQLRLVPAPAPDPAPEEQPGFFREPDHAERAAGDMT
jgi:hypothetical protein